MQDVFKPMLDVFVSFLLSLSLSLSLSAFPPLNDRHESASRLGQRLHGLKKRRSVQFKPASSHHCR